MVRSSAVLPQSDAAAVRNRLLRAAQDQILATGFFEASVDQIARRAGASKQTIYTYFDSKELLFQEVLRLTMTEASETGAPDWSCRSLADAVHAYALWVEESALKPKNMELYRANIAAATAFPTLAADLHRLRLTASDLGILLTTHPENALLPPVAPVRLANWLGVLAMAGTRHMLGFSEAQAEREVRLQGIVQLFTGGWRTAIESTPVTPTTSLPPPASSAITIEQGGRLSAARWAELLRIAAQNFSRSGLRGTSVEEIGAAAGISKMTVYKRFGNKQGLFTAAIEHAVDDLLTERSPLTFGKDIRTSLEAIALEQDRLANRQQQIQLIRLLITEAPSQPQAVQRAWCRLMAPAQAELAAQLREWQAADALHVPDATIAAEQFLLLAMRGNRRLTDTLAWDEDEARQHAQDVVLLFYR